MARVDVCGRLTAFNAEFGRMLGIPAGTAVGRALEEVAPCADRHWRDIIRGAAEAPGLGRWRLTLSHPPGGRMLDVAGWADVDSPESPCVMLLVTEPPPANGTSSLMVGVERARVAREIHDGLAQDLWLAKLAASRLARHPTLDEAGRSLCSDLLRSIDAGLTEARTAFMAMRAGAESTITMSDLIRRQIEEFSDRFGIRVECDLQPASPVSPHIAVEVLRVIGEALNNVRKHASARRVLVRMEQRASSIVLSVRDDGVGFDPGQSTDGFGRQSMHERAQSIGGRLSIASTPGRGTTVRLRVPLAQLPAVP